MWSREETRLSADVNAMKARHKRAERKEAQPQRCVNGSTAATHGCRCFRCFLVHKHGVEKARKLDAYRDAPLCNPRKS